MYSPPISRYWLTGNGKNLVEHPLSAKPLKFITRGAADPDQIKMGEDKAEEDKPKEADLAAIITAIKVELGETVKDVRASACLTDSPVCLIADEGEMDVNLERLLRRQGQLKHGMPRALELNPTDAIITTLAKRAKAESASDDGLLKKAAHLLLDQARIVEGETPTDPTELARRLGTVMARALAN